MNRSKIYILIIVLSSLTTHFLFFGHPNGTVFDEVHFGKFISGYFTHEYFFDIHPPLGKLLISGMGYIGGFKPGFSFAEIGQKFPDDIYLWLRLLPTLAGTLLPIIIFFLILRLGLSRLAAFSAAILVVFENGLLIQSRFILLDSFLLLFGFSALLAYFKYAREGKNSYLVLSGALAALSLSVKWTGATFLAIILTLYFTNTNVWKLNFQTLVRGLCALVIVPMVVYFAIFTLHFSLLTKSGPGDAFMTSEFRKTLANSADSTNASLKPLNIFQKFKELNIQMYKSNASLTAGHPYSSKWYTWPFMTRPIYYWYSSTSSSQTEAGASVASRIYFLGNPVIWWASTVAMFYLLISLARSIFGLVMSKMFKIRQSYDIASRKIKTLPVLLAGAYLFNLLPFVGITRAMFLYHYIIGLIFAIVALVYLIDKQQNKKKIFGALLIASFLIFLFFSPLTYGLPLTNSAYHLRTWFPGWQ